MCRSIIQNIVIAGVCMGLIMKPFTCRAERRSSTRWIFHFCDLKQRRFLFMVSGCFSYVDMSDFLHTSGVCARVCVLVLKQSFDSLSRRKRTSTNALIWRLNVYWLLLLSRLAAFCLWLGVVISLIGRNKLLKSSSFCVYWGYHTACPLKADQDQIIQTASSPRVCWPLYLWKICFLSRSR